jgi:hypothetical protein
VHEQKALDYELGYAPGNGVHIPETSIRDFISIKLDGLTRLINQIVTVMGEEAQLWALGADGEPGDPVRIAHLCDRFGSVYEGILEWAADVRGTSCPTDFATLLSHLAKFAGHAIRQIQDAADRLVAETERIPAHIMSDDPTKGILGITIALNIGIDDDVLDQFGAERKRLGV